MSPEALPGQTKTLARVPLRKAPRAARLCPGDLSAWLAAHVSQRERAAHAAGFEAGVLDANSKSAAALDAATQRLDAARDAALDELVHTSIDLALGVVRALLRVELPAGRYDLQGMVRDALSHSGNTRGNCVVHLHPDDAARLADVRFRAGTEIEPDESVPAGSVHLTTPQGLLVRDLDEALRGIAERLHGEVH